MVSNLHAWNDALIAGHTSRHLGIRQGEAHLVPRVSLLSSRRTIRVRVSRPRSRRLTDKTHPQLNAAVRAGSNAYAPASKRSPRVAQERGELDPALKTGPRGRLCISLLQGLLLQVGVYRDVLDIDGYARAAITLRCSTKGGPSRSRTV